ncbi:MAG: hypothetical protein ACE5GG_04720, partial [Candidatus Omnitrophota bacterium]
SLYIFERVVLWYLPNLKRRGSPSYLLSHLSLCGYWRNNWKMDIFSDDRLFLREADKGRGI